MYRGCFALLPTRYIRGRLPIPCHPVNAAVDLPVGCAGSVAGGTVEDDCRLVYVGYFDRKVLRIAEALDCPVHQVDDNAQGDGNDCESAPR